jgi:hypothetical protein
MDMKDLKQTADDAKDQTQQKFQEAKENVEDMTQGIREDIAHKGGEVKGRADQWGHDHHSKHRHDDPKAKTHSSELDQNPLDKDQ